MSQIDSKQIKDTSLSLSKVIVSDGTEITLTGGTKIKQSLIPSSPDDLVNKSYADSLSAGLNPKDSVSVISTSNITLSGTQSIDNYVLSAGDRILVNGQSSAADNGIYDVATGAWTRSSDSDGNPNNEVSLGNFAFVQFGDTYAGSGWVLNTTDATGATISVGSDTQQWTQFSSAGSYTAGSGLTLNTSGNGGEFVIDDNTVSGDGITASNGVFAVDLQSNSGLVVNSNGLAIDASAAGDGLTLTSGVLNVDTAQGITSDGTNIIINDNEIAGTGLTASSGVLSVNTDNGISTTGDNVILGGSFSQNTTLDTNTFDFNVVDGSNNIFKKVSGKDGINLVIGTDDGSGSTGRDDDGGGLEFMAIQASGAVKVFGGTSNGGELLVDDNQSRMRTTNSGGSESNITILNNGTFDSIVIKDNIHSKGAIYAADYSPNYTDRSLVDKGYVDNVLQTTVNADNGLTDTVGTISLGGSFSQNTTLDLNTSELTIEDTVSGGMFFKTGNGKVGDQLALGSDGSSLGDVGSNNVISEVQIESEAATYIITGTLSTDYSLFRTTRNTINSSVVSGASSSTFEVGETSMQITDGINSKGLVYFTDYSSNFTDRSLVDKGYVDNQVSTINADFITAVVAGDGLTGDATSGTASLAVGAGTGITVAADTVSSNADGTLTANLTSLGLTSGVSSIQDALEALETAGTYLTIDEGTPSVTSGDGSTTGLTITSTPANDSYPSVFLNGILQQYGASASNDVYFSNDGGTTARATADVTAGDTLYFNGGVNGFELSATDLIQIKYEVQI
jgi:hypothetical protein